MSLGSAQSQATAYRSVELFELKGRFRSMRLFPSLITTSARLEAERLKRRSTSLLIMKASRMSDPVAQSSALICFQLSARSQKAWTPARNESTTLKFLWNGSEPLTDGGAQIDFFSNVEDRSPMILFISIHTIWFFQRCPEESGSASDDDAVPAMIIPRRRAFRSSLLITKPQIFKADFELFLLPVVERRVPETSLREA